MVSANTSVRRQSALGKAGRRIAALHPLPHRRAARTLTISPDMQLAESASSRQSIIDHAATPGAPGLERIVYMPARQARCAPADGFRPLILSCRRSSCGPIALLHAATGIVHRATMVPLPACDLDVEANPTGPGRPAV